MKLTWLVIVLFLAPFILGDLIQLSRWLKRRKQERQMRDDLEFRRTRLSDQLTRMRQALDRAYGAIAVLTECLSNTSKARRLRDEAGRSLSNAGRDLSQASMRLSAASRKADAGPREASGISYQECSERFSLALTRLSSAQKDLNEAQRREQDAWKASKQACLASVHAAELALHEFEALESEVACQRDAVESGDYPVLAKDWDHAKKIAAAAAPQIRHYLASAYQRKSVRLTLAEESGRQGVISRVDGWCYKCEAMFSNVPDSDPAVCWSCGASLSAPN